MPRKNIANLLRGGDRRSIGRSNQVAAMVARNKSLFPELIAALWSDDLLVRLRAADAAEKVTRKNPKPLAPYKKELLGLLAEAHEPELRWHLAAMIPRLSLNAQERQLTTSLLNGYLADRSSIVKTFALQGLVDLATHDASARPALIDILREAERTGTAAMRARSRHLLRALEKTD